MKITFINAYSGQVSRGVETYLHNLANDLAVDNEVTVIQSGQKSESDLYNVVQVAFPNKANWPAVEVNPVSLQHRLFLDYFKFNELLFSIKLLHKLIDLSPEILVPLNSGWQVLICSLYCRLTNTKLVLSGQSGPGWDDRWNLLMKPDLFICLTKQQLAWAKRVTIWKQKFALIPNSVDTNIFNPHGHKFPVKLNRPIVICVAASIKSKNIDATIEAISLDNQISLLLVGSGPLDQDLNLKAEKLLGPNRFLHLSLKHEQMPDVYRAADLFILCSEHSEAFGIVYIEAMASGLGVVATDDQSRREIIGKHGFFVSNPSDPVRIHKAIKQALLVNNHKRSLLRSKKFEKRLSSEMHKQVFIDLINEQK